MNFSVNFMSSAGAVLKEAFSLKKYKAMPLVWAILVGIFMLPLAFASLICAFLVFVLGYLFSVVSLPVQSLHKLLKEEGQSIKHGAQIVVYLLSWGFIFSAYAALSFFLILLTVLYSVFSIFTYLWSLGGFKFHLFAEDKPVAIEVGGKYKTLIPAIFVAVMGVLLLIVPLLNTVGVIIEWKPEMSFELFFDIFEAEIRSTNGLRFLVSALYSAVLFAPGPKKTEE